MDALTAQQVRELLHYDPETGIFVRRFATGRGGRHKAGVPLGSSTAAGYLYTRFGKKAVYLHRLAFLYMTGDWPPAFVDHIDGNPANNRWANLRPATRALNAENRRRVRSDRKHGTLLGVKKHRHRWQARIRVSGVDRFLGSFPTEAGAHEAYVAAKRQLHEGCTL